jgi:hypothetical protein
MEQIVKVLVPANNTLLPLRAAQSSPAPPLNRCCAAGSVADQETNCSGSHGRFLPLLLQCRRKAAGQPVHLKLRWCHGCWLLLQTAVIDPVFSGCCLHLLPAWQIASLEPASHAYSFWEGVPISGKQAFGRLFRLAKTTKVIVPSVAENCVHFAGPWLLGWWQVTVQLNSLSTEMTLGLPGQAS